jgi:hypothetical protein
MYEVQDAGKASGLLRTYCVRRVGHIAQYNCGLVITSSIVVSMGKKCSKGLQLLCTCAHCYSLQNQFRAARMHASNKNLVFSQGYIYRDTLKFFKIERRCTIYIKL